MKGMSQKLSSFARRLFNEWRRLSLPAEGHVVVAVSGGADSCALLLALDELARAERLKLRVTVAHLNHGLRGAASEEDARWVAELAKRLGCEAALGQAEVKERARGARDNLEQVARRARYEFLAAVAAEREAWGVLTGHTLDDQAETVLLRLLRGSGAEGLSGMRVVRALVAEESILLARPLLGWARRAETEGYCRERGVAFRLDEMNEDESFARARVRHKLLPLLESFNPRAPETIARSADLLREDAAALAQAAAALLAEACARSPCSSEVARDEAEVAEDRAAKHEAEIIKDEAEEAGKRFAGDAPPLRVEVLRDAPPAVRRRALRLWIERGRGDLRRITRAHLLTVESLLEGERGGRIAELPGGARIERRRGQLQFIK